MRDRAQDRIRPTVARTILLLLAVGLSRVLPAQETGPDGAGILARCLRGDLLGPVETDLGPVRGWLRFEPVAGGAWLRGLGAWLRDGRPIRSFLLVLREEKDGRVRAWRFDSDGGVEEWSGAVSARGLGLRRPAAADRPGGRLDLEFDQGSVLLSEAEDGGRRLAAGRLDPTNRRPTWPPDEEALARVRSNPYAWYLGRFRGSERGPDGPALGESTTEAILAGAWFHTTWRSLRDGREVHSGFGLVRCDPDGRYRLYWFDRAGRRAVLAGRVTAAGAEAFRRDAEGRAIERHTDTRVAGGYRYRLEVRDGPDSPWRDWLVAEYRRVEERKP